MQSFEISTLLAAPPTRVYCAWLDPYELSAFTGRPALVEPAAGGRFLAQDGYISSEFLALRPYSEIVQVWRTADLPCCYADSLLTLLFQPVDRCATLLTVQHAQVPDHLAAHYQQSWVSDYLEPMRRYFAEG